MDRIDDLLARTRDPRVCAEFLLPAPRNVAGRVAQQVAAVLFSPNVAEGVAP
jgi:hypothetical protein